MECHRRHNKLETHIWSLIEAALFIYSRSIDISPRLSGHLSRDKTNPFLLSLVSDSCRNLNVVCRRNRPSLECLMCGLWGWKRIVLFLHESIKRTQLTFSRRRAWTLGGSASINRSDLCTLRTNYSRLCMWRKNTIKCGNFINKTELKTQNNCCLYSVLQHHPNFCEAVSRLILKSGIKGSLPSSAWTHFKQFFFLCSRFGQLQLPLTQPWHAHINELRKNGKRDEASKILTSSRAVHFLRIEVYKLK